MKPRSQEQIDKIKEILQATFEYNLDLMGDEYIHWKLIFGDLDKLENTRMVDALGYCSYTHSHIALSKNLIMYGPLDEIADTLLHEMAHILLPGECHNHKWRKLARHFGVRDRAKSAIDPSIWLYISNEKWLVVSKQEDGTLIPECTCAKKLKDLDKRYYSDRQEQTENKLYMIDREKYIELGDDEKRIRYLTR